VEMHHVRYFLAVAREGNFTRAARESNVSQPSLSGAIMQLEKEFGGALFYREPDNIRLTELGRIVEPFMVATLENANSARSVARRFNGEKKCLLRLGVMRTISPDVFEPLLASMRANNPDVSIAILDGGPDDLRKRLLEGRLDAAIYACSSVVDAEKLHEIALYRERLFVIVPTGHELAARREIDVDDLDGQPHVMRADQALDGATDIVFARRDLESRALFRSEREDWAQAMVASGAGFAFMPRHCITHPRLVGRPLRGSDCWREIKFVTVMGRAHKSGLGALVRGVAKMNWRAIEASSDTPTPLARPSPA
jgi:LysR family transcriptional regulator, hydrogen peroxide-inducible genes activator